MDASESQITRGVWTGSIIPLLAGLRARDDDDDRWIHTLFENESQSIIPRWSLNSRGRRTERKSMIKLTVYEPEPGNILNAVNK